MLTVYESESSYSVEKRIELIKEYVRNKHIIIEIGGNEQGIFKRKLEELFDNYISVDVNGSANNTEVSMGKLKDFANVLVAYFVLEHIVNLEEFLKSCWERLEKNGIFIIEVPDATKYYSDIVALNQMEHVNHFTPENLTMLMRKMGFELLRISRESVSRDCGFTGIYRKIELSKKKLTDNRDMCIITESCLLDGVRHLQQSEKKLYILVEILKSKVKFYGGGSMVYWCANEMLRTIIDASEPDIFKDCLIIDEDPRKNEFYLDYKAETSKRAWDSGKLQKIKYMVICSDIRVKSIIATLKDRYKEIYDNISIYFIDRNWNLNCYKNEM